MDAVIRHETRSDAAAIRAVTAAAFVNAPHSDHKEHFIVDALRRAGALTVSLVAEQRRNIVGHAAASPVLIPDGSPGWYGLSPVSVTPVLHGQGIGTRLVRAVLRELQELGAAGCVVFGDPAYYSRFGFKPVPGLVLPGVPAELFQALAFGPISPRGEVVYHEAFNAWH